MKYLQKTVFVLCLTLLYACEDDVTKIDGGSATCENKEIVKVLKNEPAYIRKSCFQHTDREEFYFEFTTEYPFNGGLFPCDSIPVQYRKEGLSVKIGGNITSCKIWKCGGPNVKIAPTNVFELRTIKINEK
jgi:hypothetical protein